MINSNQAGNANQYNNYAQNFSMGNQGQQPQFDSNSIRSQNKIQFQQETFQKQDADDDIYNAMKKVKEISEGRPYYDPKSNAVASALKSPLKSDLKKSSAEKDIESSRLLGEDVTANRGKAQMNNDFYQLFNENLQQINSCRDCLMHLIIIVIIIDCIIWEENCMFLNVCYGEEIEFDKGISCCLFALIILTIIFLYCLYNSVSYLKKNSIIVYFILIIILAIIAIFLGIYQIVKGTRRKDDDKVNIYSELTTYGKDYYERLNRKYFKSNQGGLYKMNKEYRFKMIFSGATNLLMGVLSMIVIFTAISFNCYFSQTRFDWRPILVSCLHNSRMKKTLELYRNNIERYREVFCAENPGVYLGNQPDNLDSKRFNYLKNISNLDSVDNSIRDKLSKSKNSNVQVNNDDDFQLPKADPKTGDSNIGRNQNRENLNNSNDDNSASHLNNNRGENLNNNYNRNSGILNNNNNNNDNKNNMGDINTNVNKEKNE